MTKQKKYKYTVENLLPALREAAEFRDKLIAIGFTDNGGAIHSAERILNILAPLLKYGRLGHINNYKKGFKNAEFSESAYEAKSKGEPIEIEHVTPHRKFTQSVIEKIRGKINDEALKEFIADEFRLLCLTKEERRSLDKVNRTKRDPKRVDHIRTRKHG